MKKAIIFDSGTLINFSMNGLISLLKDLNTAFKGDFIITPQVKYEVIDKPINIRRFQLGALKLNQLFNEGVLKLPTDVGIKGDELEKYTKKYQKLANTAFKTDTEMINLIHKGEASCFAVSKLLTDKGIKNVISIDERTARMLTEKPENLEKLMEQKLHTSITSNKDNYKFFKGFQFIRSAELVYIAYKKNLLKIKHSKLLEALLFAVKYKGCAISTDEIMTMKKL